jgi:hypothetical protein
LARLTSAEAGRLRGKLARYLVVLDSSTDQEGATLTVECASEDDNLRPVSLLADDDDWREGVAQGA